MGWEFRIIMMRSFDCLPIGDEENLLRAGHWDKDEENGLRDGDREDGASI